MKRSDAGFSMVEVLVAVTVLGVGIVALVGSSALVTRMIGRGKSDTRAAQVATTRLEMLRALAYSTSPHCTAGTLVSGGPVTTSGVTESWTVVTNGTAKNITVNVSYKTVRGTRNDAVQTRIEC